MRRVLWIIVLAKFLAKQEFSLRVFRAKKRSHMGSFFCAQCPLASMFLILRDIEQRSTILLFLFVNLPRKIIQFVLWINSNFLISKQVFIQFMKREKRKKGPIWELFFAFVKRHHRVKKVLTEFMALTSDQIPKFPNVFLLPIIIELILMPIFH